ncbi:hypothetical protein GE061_010123 [Apolygus lucorum]|uniref:Uncharacterized protein n=1 Tax=Apolygus lucorum TaxID=248454 RepID=A0A6A4J1N5_APOLU|nr:hypothetical protein GE061_010123 [Apolygus lucorum]
MEYHDNRTLSTVIKKVHEISIRTRFFIILNAIAFPAASSIVKWDLETYMRVRREVENREQCCSIPKINSMLEQFPLLNVKHIIRIAGRNQLEQYCMEYKKHLDPLNEYLKTCCFDRKDGLVKQQLEGLRELHVTLCLDKVFYEELSKNARCLEDVVTTTGDCLAKEANHTVTNSSDKDICPRLRAIVDCFTFQAVNDCSMAAANLFNKLFKRVIKATVRVDCGVCFHVLPDTELATSLNISKLITALLVLSVMKRCVIASLCLVVEEELYEVSVQELDWSSLYQALRPH